MIYNWNYEEPDAKVAEEAAELAAAARIHPALGRLLHERGMRTPAEVTQFFRPQLTTLHDPFLMNDMDVASRGQTQRSHGEKGKNPCLWRL